MVNPATSDLLSYTTLRATTINRISGLTGETKRGLFLAGLRTSALNQFNSTYKDLPKYTFTELRNHFTLVGRLMPTAEYTNFAKPADFVPPNDAHISNRFGSTTEKNAARNTRNRNNNNGNRNNRSGNRNNSDNRNNQPTLTAAQRAENRKAEWIAKGRDDCGYCRSKGMTGDQLKHYYGECPNNTYINRRNSNNNNNNVGALVSANPLLPTDPDGSRIIDIKESTTPGDPITNFAPCPFVFFRLKGITFTALLDTGSPFNLMSSTMVETLQLTQYRETKPTLIRSALKHSFQK